MTTERDETDQRIDDSLRSLGTRMSDTLAPESLRAHVRDVLDGRSSTHDIPVKAMHRRVARLRWTVTGLTTVAAALALASTMLFVHVKQLEQAAEGQQIGKTHVVPVQSGAPAEYLILTQHYDMCSRAQEVTPWFEHLPDEFKEAPAVFAVLDLSPTCASRAQDAAQRLGIDLEKFRNGDYPKTGMVWVIDLATQEVVYEMHNPSEFAACEKFLNSQVAKR